tara:strand:- start:353 stop:676 length:324 start_codon:yes stop_codon:yes gene_type:complete
MNLYIKNKKMRIKFIFISLFFLLTSCGSMSEAGKALRNEKTRTTDEFLIEKRGPLSVPPKVGELPRPNTSSEDKKNKKGILETAEDDETSKEKSRIENVFLEEIRNN